MNHLNNITELSLKDFAEIIGRSPSTILKWEERGYLPSPPRSKSGHRKYSIVQAQGIYSALHNSGWTGAPVPMPEELKKKFKEVMENGRN